MALIKPNNTTQPGKVSPSRMLADFSNKQTFMWFLIAFAIHVAIVGATSVGYIKNLMAGPPPPATQPAETTEQAAPPAAPTDAKPTADAAKTDKTDEQKTLDQRKDSPMAKTLTETAKPEEIPTGPRDSGIGLDESLDTVK